MVQQCIEQHIPEGHLEAVGEAEDAERQTLEQLREMWERES